MLKISGEFVMVHAAYQTHLGQDYFFAPRATLADDIIWLLIVKAGITRASLLQVSFILRSRIKKEKEYGHITIHSSCSLISFY